MQHRLETEVKVGIFVAAGLALVMVTILLLGGANSIFVSQVRYKAHFVSTDGLITGTKVALNGIRIGVVEGIDLDEGGKSIRVTMLVGKQYRTWIREGSTAEIVTQGMLGDKYISLTAGAPEQAALEPGSEIPISMAKDLKSFLTDGERLMASLTSIAASLDRIMTSFERGNRAELLFSSLAKTSQNISALTEKMNREIGDAKIKSTVNHLNSILEKIDSGTGTLGALVNDPALYEDAKALVGGANRNRIVRNLVRKTIKESEEQEKPEPQK